MKKFKSITLAIGLACSGTLVAQTSGELLPAGVDDLKPGALTAAKAAPSAHLERAPVQFAWRLDPSKALQAPAPHVAQSREFWTRIDAAAFKRGYAFDTTAEGTLVRISPAGARSAAFEPEDLQIRVNGTEVASRTVLKRSAPAEELKTLGADFGNGSQVLQLQSIAAGSRVELSLPKASGEYLLHVLEPQSEVVLQLSASRDVVAAGSTLSVRADLLQAGVSGAASRMSGLVTAPDGSSFDIDFRAVRTGYVADIALPVDAMAGEGLWEVHAFAAGNAGRANVLRDTRTAFTVSQPTVRLGGSYTLEGNRSKGLAITLPVQAAVNGRFELRGVLYGTSAGGLTQPMAIAHSAQWIDAGNGRMTLRFGPELLKDGLSAPFELRDVELIDQAALAPTERRELALVIDSLD